MCLGGSNQNMGPVGICAVLIRSPSGGGNRKTHGALGFFSQRDSGGSCIHLSQPPERSQSPCDGLPEALAARGDDGCHPAWLGLGRRTQYCHPRHR